MSNKYTTPKGTKFFFGKGERLVLQASRSAVLMLLRCRELLNAYMNSYYTEFIVYGHSAVTNLAKRTSLLSYIP